MTPEPEQRERGGHAQANASGSALGQVAAVSVSANRSQRHLPEWGAVSGADEWGYQAVWGSLPNGPQPRAPPGSTVEWRQQSAVPLRVPPGSLRCSSRPEGERRREKLTLDVGYAARLRRTRVIILHVV